MDSIFGSPIVQTAIGMILIWFLGALVCSAVVQLVSSLFGFKANNLWRMLRSVLAKDGTAEPTKPAAMQALNLARDPVDPMVKDSDPGDLAAFLAVVEKIPGVTKDTVRRVSSINREDLTTALVAAAGTGGTGLDNTELGKLVAALPAGIKADGTKLKAWFDGWFDQQMAVLQAAYRRKIRWWTTLIAAIVTLVIGLNSFDVATTLYHQPTTRAALTAQADRTVQAPLTTCPAKDGAAKTAAPSTPTTAPAFADQLECVRANAKQLDDLKLSYWQAGHTRPDNGAGWVLMVLGFVATVAALSAGAPFWYDVLKRIMGARAALSGGAGGTTSATVTTSSSR